MRSFLSNSKRPFAQQANVLLDGHVLPGGGPVAALLGYVGHQRSPETAKRGLILWLVVLILHSIGTAHIICPKNLWILISIANKKKNRKGNQSQKPNQNYKNSLKWPKAINQKTILLQPSTRTKKPINEKLIVIPTWSCVIIPTHLAKLGWLQCIQEAVKCL